jgi:sucrose-6-phosphate hydrolase SacC (GH32 family)
MRVLRNCTTAGWIALLALVACRTAARPGTDKTLVAWAAPADLAQQGGSVLTIQSGERFDAIVLGERAPARWMLGSELFRRTQADQAANAAETAAGVFVQIAIVHEGGNVRIYRDGDLYAEYRAANVDLLEVDNHIALFGLRHIGAASGAPFAGAIEDARIYARALARDEIRALRPDQPSAIAPLAWWDFEGAQPRDRAGRFAHHVPCKGARLEGGKLVLDGAAFLVAAVGESDARLATRADAPRAPWPPYAPRAPAWPAHPPDEWLTFHLAHPGPGEAMPGDPNCAFDHAGRYHLHYIFRDDTGFAFAHVSSADLVHWAWHPTVLAPPTTGHGMFSGTGFLTDDGAPAIIYHGEGSGRNWIQRALDDRLERWSEPVAVIPRTAAGEPVAMRQWDPDCWRMDGSYYAYSGGSNPQLMKSRDLRTWLHLGDLLHRDYPADLGVPKDEDISCGNMFRIGEQWMLLCISHTLGARYYLGRFEDEKFLPHRHAMLSFGGNRLFAPESLLTRDGRRVMWAWLLNLPVAPSGVQCLPRELELAADGELRIQPLRELAALRREAIGERRIAIGDGETVAIEGVGGRALELEVRVAPPLPEAFGVHLLGDKASVAVDRQRGVLRAGAIEAPLSLDAAKELTLRVFVDRNLIEVFADDRQAVVFAHDDPRAEALAQVFARGGGAHVAIKAWRLASIWRPRVR